MGINSQEGNVLSPSLRSPVLPNTRHTDGVLLLFPKMTVHHPLAPHHEARFAKRFNLTSILQRGREKFYLCSWPVN